MSERALEIILQGVSIRIFDVDVIILNPVQTLCLTLSNNARFSQN